MRILFIPGINMMRSALNGWKRDLSRAFPNIEILYLDDYFYQHFRHHIIQKIVKQGVQVVQDKKPTIIIGYSFGGIIAKAIIAKAKSANIIHLITMASPHTMNAFGLKAAKQYISAPEKILNIPTKTYGGYFDPIVPYPFTSLKKENHTNLLVEHLAFIYSKKVRKKIIKYLLLQYKNNI